jgi:hypothetical protein
MTVPPALPRGAHVVVLHRWLDSYAHYERYLDHGSLAVTYVVTALNRGTVPAGAAGHVVVDDITDLSAVRAALAGPVRRHGRPAAVLALQEGDLAVAARLREEHGAAGRRWPELERFLDKRAMLDAATGTGVAVPPYRQVTGPAQIAGFAGTHGWPLVVKPLEGRASVGVRQLDGPADLAALPPRLPAPVLVQRHVPHPVFHADGYFDGHSIRPWKLARYVNLPGSPIHGPLAFNGGEPVGEVEVSDPRLLAAARDFLAVLVPRLSAQPWVFHCELFIDEEAAQPRCTFLEVGCRPGGGEIPFVWREVYGIDLMALECALQCGSVPAAPAEPAGTEVGGSLLVPLVVRPALVTAAPSMLGRPDGPYTEWLPPVGAVVGTRTGSYEFVAGRFRFRGPSTQDVTGRVRATARDYTLGCTPLTGEQAAAAETRRAGAA